MDHAMNFLYDYLQHSVEYLRKEHGSGKYSKLSECPTYKEVKAYCDSYNALVRYYYSEEYRDRALIKPSHLIKEWS